MILTSDPSVFWTVCLSISFCHGFKVSQPRSQTLSSDLWAKITCNHSAPPDSIQDVRLNRIPQAGRPVVVLCREGSRSCGNVVLNKITPNQYVFVMLHLGPDAKDFRYQCEVSMTDKRTNVDYTEKGTPTELLPAEPLPGDQEAEQHCKAPPPPPHDQLKWILIGVLGVMSLYSCVVTSFYIRLKSRRHSADIEDSTYVEMRKSPPQRLPNVS